MSSTTRLHDAITEQLERPVLRPQRCETCKFADATRDSESGEITAVCRRMPPRAQTIIGSSNTGPRVLGSVSAYPTVKAHDWCGEWQPHIATAS